MKINHIGYVVEHIEDYLENSIFPREEHLKIVTDFFQLSRITFLRGVKGDCIELIEPISSESFVFNFLKKKKGNLHHICYEVNDLLLTREECIKKDCIIIMEPTPAFAFDNKKVMFVYTKNREIIEFVEI